MTTLIRRARTVTMPAPGISLSYKSSPTAALAKRGFASNRSASRSSDRVIVIAGVVAILLIFRLPEVARDIAFVTVAVVGFGLAFRYFAQIWMLVLGTLPIIQLQGSLFGVAKVSAIRFLLMGLTLVFLLLRKPRGYWTVLTRRVGVLALGLFIFANILSAVHLGQADAVFRSVAYSEPFLVFMLTYYMVRQDPGNARRVLRALVIGGLCVCILGIVEFMLQQSILDVLGVSYSGTEDPRTYLLEDRYGLGGRISSTFIQPVYAATGFFIYTLVSAFYLIIYKPKFPRFLVVLAPIFGVFLVLITGSRGPLVALVPTTLAFTLLVGSKRAVLAVIGVAVVLFGLSAYDVLPGLRAYWTESINLSSQQSANVFGRVDLTTMLLDIFKENPVLGFGPGMIQKLGFGGSGEFARLAGLENQYAVILAEGGILAGSTYLLFMLAVFGHLLKVRRTSQGLDLKYWGLMSLVLFTYVFAGAAFANFLVGPVLNTVMAIYAVTVAGYETWANQPA